MNFGLLHIMCCRWFVQTVHGRHFSKKKWDEFVKCRPVPGSPVAFAEIEVMLCNIPNRLDLQSEKMEEEKEREGDFFVSFVTLKGWYEWVMMNYCIKCILSPSYLFHSFSLHLLYM